MKWTTMILLVFAPLAMLLGTDDVKPVKEPSELTAARQTYQAEQARATAAYVAKLEALKTKLGTGGRIDDAILVKAEVDKIKAEQDAQLCEPKSKAVVGKWTWHDGSVVELKVDGTVTYSGKTSFATWEDKDGKAIVSWPHGNKDTLTLSANGKKADGVNQSGFRFSASKMK